MHAGADQDEHWRRWDTGLVMACAARHRFDRLLPFVVVLKTHRGNALISFELSTQALGAARFGLSPLVEVAGSLRLLTRPRPGDPNLPWVRWATRRSAEVDLALLRCIAPGGKWVADFLAPQLGPSPESIDEQLVRLGALSRDRIVSDLMHAWGSNPASPALTHLIRESPDPGRLLARALRDYWDVMLEPHWHRIRSVLEDDIAFRTATLTASGVLQTIADLHPQLSVTESSLRIDKPHHADEKLHGSSLVLTPSVFLWPGLLVGDCAADGLSLTYAARGVARCWEHPDVARRHQGTDRWIELLGHTRASVLLAASTPVTTAELAERLHQSRPSVNQHLTTLRDVGLLLSRRDGKRVLYRQSPLAEALLAPGEELGSTAS